MTKPSAAAENRHPRFPLACDAVTPEDHRAVVLNVLKVMIALAFPAVVFVVFNGFQEARSGRDVALAQMQPVVRPLNMRLRYNADDAAAFWSAIGEKG